jgi:hypothetical protein
VPFTYFKVKRPLEEDLREIDINSIDRKFRRPIEKKIFSYELMGFKPLAILESKVDEENKIYCQLMIHNTLGISLALFYSVKVEKNSKYKEIEKEYLVFEFENSNQDLIQITNNKGMKFPTRKGIYTYFIDFEEDVSFDALILDISKKGLINKQSDTLIKIQNNPLEATKKDSINERDYLLKSKYFIQKENHLTISIKASLALVFKEIYPLNKFFNFLETKKSKKYFGNNEIFLDSYYDENFTETKYDKKINNLKTLKEYFNTNKRYIEIFKKYEIKKIRFSFYDKIDDSIEENLEIIHIDIELTAQKKISNNRCLYSNYQININNENENEKSFLYYNQDDIRLYKYKEINPIIEVNNCVEIIKVQEVIYHKYKEASIVEISLEIFDNNLSYIALVYKLKIDEEPVKIYLDALTAKILVEK